MMKNVMIDLETLDTRPTSVILSIGAVAFDPTLNCLGDFLDAELTNRGELERQQTLFGRTVSASTVQWWMGQSALAKRIFSEQSMSGADRVDLQTGLKLLSDLIDANGGRDDVIVWANPPSFDLAILRSAYEATGIEVPWKHYNERCYRTLKALTKRQYKVKAFEGIEHKALDDALHQARNTMGMLSCLALT